MEGSQPRLSEASSWRDREGAVGVDALGQGQGGAAGVPGIGEGRRVLTWGGGSGRDDDVAIPSALASPRTETQSCT